MAGPSSCRGDVQRMIDAMRPMMYRDGDVVFREGDPPDGFHLILSGSVVVTQKHDADSAVRTHASHVRSFARWAWMRSNLSSCPRKAAGGEAAAGLAAAATGHRR